VLAIDRNESSDHNERSPIGDIVAPHGSLPGPGRRRTEIYAGNVTSSD
jgi:hypothetical protein